jgi:hypothetical protein
VDASREGHRQLAVLRWARDHEHKHTPFLCDSDLMLDLDLGADDAHAVLLALQARGELEFRNVPIAGPAGFSLCRIRTTRAGLERLRRDGNGGRPPLLRRLAGWLRR